MATPDIAPENFEERLIWRAITGTYVFYALGALYIVAPVVGWILLASLARSYFLPSPGKPGATISSIPVTAWIWVAGMSVMLVSLVVGHLQFDLGTAKTIKSSVGWAKGWALIAIFILAGCLPVRPALIYRACAIVCLHTLLLLPLFVGAYLLGLPQTLYVSPLQAVGGPGPEYFALNLYEIEPGSGARWRMFTPWAPALGFVANIYFLFALNECNPRWKALGIAGSLVMILMSKSRLALVALLTVWIASWLLSRLNRPSTYFFAAGSSVLSGFAGLPLLQAAERARDAFRSARADSTRVREALARIALERWQTEGPIWGHGIVERGPHLVEYMPIGSHHSWYGLLFVKGIVGLAALAVPMFFTFCALLRRAQHSRLGSVGLAILLILFLYTFGENLEILAYLYWPALVVLGSALNENRRQPPVLQGS